MRLKQVVHQAPNLVQRQLGGSVRIEHRGLVDVLALAGKRSLHRQRLHIHVCLQDRSKLLRQGS